MSDDPCEGDYAVPQFPDGAVIRDIPIVNRKGLHARATAKFVQCVEKFDAEIMVSRCGETVGGWFLAKQAQVDQRMAPLAALYAGQVLSGVPGQLAAVTQGADPLEAFTG